MTTDKDLKKVEASFKKILSKHIFALCKANMDVSSADMLNSLENECSPCQMICLRGIKNLKIQVKEQAEKVAPKVEETERKIAEVSTTLEAKKEIKAEVKIADKNSEVDQSSQMVKTKSKGS